MNLINLLEEFKDYVNNEPVFYATKNKGLTSQEKKEIALWKNVRFICVANRIIYIFPENLFHVYVSEKMKINYHEYWKNKYPIFFGEANVIQNNIVYSESYDLGQIISSIRFGNDEEQEHAKFQLNRLAKQKWVLALKYIIGFNEVIKNLLTKNRIYNKEE